MFVDENSARMMNLLKMSHLRLAENLTIEGRTEDALNILNQIKEKFLYVNAPYYSPYNNFFNYYNLRWIDLYYRNGAHDQAEEVYSLFIEDLADCIRFYEQPNSFAARFRGELEMALNFVQSLEQLAESENDQQLKDLLVASFPTKIQK